MGGTGWYRKTFSLSASSREMQTFINFDGVYMDCDVWINGKHAGSQPYGYIAFNLNISTFLNTPGQPNVIAVRVRNEGKNSRWYSGSGIYRRVQLISVNPVHIAPWGVFITAYDVTSAKANVKVATTIENSGIKATDLKIRTRILTSEGSIAVSNETSSRTISTRNLEVSQSISVIQPELWSIENPYLYTAEVELVSNGLVIDMVKVPSAYGPYILMLPMVLCLMGKKYC
ncbi:MAG: hypothetical protein HC905_10660 [Bacteroidales bacterium]|nr:hypothetical protein [Bacteroidales bacterium]